MTGQEIEPGKSYWVKVGEVRFKVQADWLLKKAPRIWQCTVLGTMLKLAVYESAFCDLIDEIPRMLGS